MILKKKTKKRTDSTIVEKIGYEGDKNGTLLWKRDENGEIIRDKKNDSIIDEDVTDVVHAWEEFKKNNL